MGNWITKALKIIKHHVGESYRAPDFVHFGLTVARSHPPTHNLSFWRLSDYVLTRRDAVRIKEFPTRTVCIPSHRCQIKQTM